MKLSVVYPVMNQFELANLALKTAATNLSGENEVEFIVIDNGSDTSYFEQAPGGVPLKVRRHEKSIGVYPTFWGALKIAEGDIIAYFHSDLIVCESGWDKRITNMFEIHDNIGMVGFVGSDEIDSNGGRGGGTTSNFQGNEYRDFDGLGNERVWRGSKASDHGRTNAGLMPAVTVDGCAMVFRRTALEQIAQRENFPPHHFYDRLLSCEVREKGWKMGTFGIACDHISGQTVNQEDKYKAMAAEWWDGQAEKGVKVPLVFNDDGTVNWDITVYAEAERQWLGEYRDTKHLVPCRV